jgi:hypothetical protein
MVGAEVCCREEVECPRLKIGIDCSRLMWACDPGAGDNEPVVLGIIPACDVEGVTAFKLRNVGSVFEMVVGVAGVL